MARSRNIKPGFFDNETLAECSFQARLLFVALWQLADCDGLVEDRPRRIKSHAFPYDDVDCDDCAQQLADRGFIVRYTVGETKVIAIPEFKKHQKPHKNELSSGLPKSGKNPNSSGKSPNGSRTNRTKSRTVRDKNRSLMNDERGMRNDECGKMKDECSVPDELPKSLDTDSFRAAWTSWKEFRLSKRKPISEQGAAAQLKQLEPLGASKAIECINVSIANDYQGLFPERVSNAHRPGQSKINSSAGQQYREGGPRAADHGTF